MPQSNEFEITEGHRKSAEKLTHVYREILESKRKRPYLQRERRQERARARVASEIAEGTPLHDVTAQVEMFAEDLRLANRWGTAIPMAEVNEVGLVPILTGAAGSMD